MNQLWVDKYRPRGLDGYVFKDTKQKTRIDQWVSQGALPHMLLSGSPGTGKSTLINSLLTELNIDSFDILNVNASHNSGVDYIRDTVTRFAETMGAGSMRYVFLDEADYLSIGAQATLRGTMEKYANSVRFLMTCNYPSKIIPALHSRCETGRMHIENLDMGEFFGRLVSILDQEKVEIDPDALETVVEKTYPDLRRGISMIQANSFSGKLVLPDADSELVADFRLDMIALFKSGKYADARKLVCDKLGKDEYEDMYTFMYQNLEIWATDPDKQNKSIMAIRDGLVKHTMCADTEMNLSATFVELEMIANGIL